jgi:hypothetical protein
MKASLDRPTYQTLTPIGHLEAIQQRLDAMLRAVQCIQAFAIDQTE